MSRLFADCPELTIPLLAYLGVVLVLIAGALIQKPVHELESPPKDGIHSRPKRLHWPRRQVKRF